MDDSRPRDASVASGYVDGFIDPMGEGRLVQSELKIDEWRSLFGGAKSTDIEQDSNAGKANGLRGSPRPLDDIARTHWDKELAHDDEENHGAGNQ